MGSLTRVEEVNTDEYDSVVDRSEEATVYHTSEFLDVLRQVLPGARLVRLGVYDGGNIKGAIPCFIQKREIGAVLNSLPFLGSNGGCIFSGKATSSRVEEKRALLKAFTELATTNDCISESIISSPCDPNDSYYLKEIRPDYTMDRVAQILNLPRRPEGLLGGLFTKRCRNSVRHAIREGVTVAWDSSVESLGEVDEGQRMLMHARGTTPRPSSFFRAISKHFEKGGGYRVYKASLGDDTIAQLLVLYHYPRTVEYAVPVVRAEFRKYAPMNLIVHQVALDAVEEGYKTLSFGGTRPGQSELYQFKASFGAEDYPYHYFTRTFDGLNRLLSLKEETISSEFKWFFVFPFPMRQKSSSF